MQDFEKELMLKYPDLFPVGEDGKPTYSSCGIGGLVEWEPIIDAACAHINSYCKHSYKSVPTKKLWPRFKKFLYHKIFKKIYNVTYKLLDPYRGIIPQEIKKKNFYTIKPEWQKLAESRKRCKWQKSLAKFYFHLMPKDSWEKVYPPQVKLAQTKAKFGMARIYTDGGDDHTRAIISFTEGLCDKITQGKLEIKKP